MAHNNTKKNADAKATDFKATDSDSVYGVLVIRDGPSGGVNSEASNSNKDGRGSASGSNQTGGVNERPGTQVGETPEAIQGQKPEAATQSEETSAGESQEEFKIPPREYSAAFRELKQRPRPERANRWVDPGPSRDFLILEAYHVPGYAD